METQQIRKEFISFFTDKNHRNYPSSSLVPQQDKTLLFTNSGMVQFKDIFTGMQSPAYPRVVTAQRCMRAGGKHNDLDQVGKTARHHTYFEMLGNFSFGDYFKHEAIPYAWDCLTKTFDIPEKKLWITIYHDDQESEAIWLDEVGISPTRLIKITTDDNFWQMGDVGPCGPCSEIFYDYGPEVPGGPPGSPDAHLDRFTEIWNIVFMQYFTDQDGVRTKLPKPSIDTGMGLERLAAVLQGKTSNYDTNEFTLIKNHILELSTHSSRSKSRNETQQVALNVIADHLRAMTFLLFDGVVPSNEGRGYVLRRILRRAIRYAQLINITEPFLSQLVPLTLSLSTIPEAMQKQASTTITHYIHKEEEQFLDTLQKGLIRYEKIVEKLHQPILPGEEAFKLYDTYGFPIDIIQDISQERGITVDTEMFNLHMKAQKTRSTKKHTVSIQSPAILSSIPPTTFTGYDYDTVLQSNTTITAILKDNSLQQSLPPEEDAAFTFNSTPFYAESGGQAGDQGMITLPHGFITVSDTVSVGATILHVGTYHGTGDLAINQSAKAMVDISRRTKIAANHSATHLLQYALRQVLGSSVHQKGSHVTDEYLRFDFSHDRALTKSEIQHVETIVNQQVTQNTKTTIQHTSYSQAVTNGALAFSEEQYQDEVRVLTIGDSQELCGGTHVSTTGEIGSFMIVEEAAIAQGMRRIVAITAQAIQQRCQHQASILSTIAKRFNCANQDILKQIDASLEKAEQLSQHYQELTRRGLTQYAQQLISQAQKIRAINFITDRQTEYDANTLKQLTEIILSQSTNTLLLLAHVDHEQEENRGVIIIAASRSIATSHSAKDLCELLKPILTTDELPAKGGGRPELAQLGCSMDNYQNAITATTSWLKK